MQFRAIIATLLIGAAFGSVTTVFGVSSDGIAYMRPTSELGLTASADPQSGKTEFFATTDAPKSDPLTSVKPANCNTVAELPLADLQTMAYLKNCLDTAGVQNAPALSGRVIEFILWDPVHDKLTGFATWKEADDEKSNNDEAEIYVKDDLGWPVLSDALNYRDEHGLNSAN